MKYRNRVLLAVTLAMVMSMPLIGSISAQTNVAKNVIAKAEAVIEKLGTTCKPDIEAYCPKVSLGEGRMAFCMLAHEDKISDKCFSALFDAADSVKIAVKNVWHAADACDQDIEKICGTVEPGEGRIAQCLIDNKAKLGSTCHAEIEGFQTRIKK